MVFCYARICRRALIATRIRTMRRKCLNIYAKRKNHAKNMLICTESVEKTTFFVSQLFGNARNLDQTANLRKNVMKIPSSNLGRNLVASVCLSTLMCNVGVAQEAEQDMSDDRRLQKVTVTAQKQETNLQETPIAITAISEEILTLQGVVDVTDITGMAPNLTVNTGILTASQAVIGIRGVAVSADELLTLDGPVGLYIDGVYIGRSAGAALEVADIVQVEVMRGPQGTLFGRNTTGGAINFLTRRPEDEQSFSTSVGLGDTNGRTISATVHSGVLENGAKLSGTLNFYGIDGDTDNKFTDKDKDPNAFTSTAARFGVEFDPNPLTNVYYSFDYATFEQYAPVIQTTIVAPHVEKFLEFSTTTDGCDLDVHTTIQDEYCLDDYGSTENTTFGHMLKVEREFSNFTLRSTTGIRSWENTIEDSDLDGFGEITGKAFDAATTFAGLPANLIVNFVCQCATPTPQDRQNAAGLEQISSIRNAATSLYAADNKRDQNQWSQEFELIDNKKDDNFDWVVGLFYFHEESSENNTQTIGYVLDMNQILANPNFGAAAPLLVAAHTAKFDEATRYRARHTVAPLVYSTDADSLALYGQGTYRADGPEGQLGWTFGLRYSSDKKSISQTQAFEKNDDLDDSAVTGHLIADYRFNPDFNGYAKYARGYKSGGFNARTEQEPFKAEYLNSFEVGFKSEVSDGTVRINGAIFQSKYTDQQVVSPVAIAAGQGFQNLIINAGSRDYTGLELEFLAQPNENLTLNAALGTVNINTKEWPWRVDGEPANIADEIVPSNVPELTINAGGIYRWDLENGDLTGRINIVHEGSRYFFPNPRESTFTKDLQADARTLVDFQLRWDNVTVNKGRSSAYVMLWIKNLTDETYITRAIDYGALGFGGVIYGAPRSFGVNVGVTW